MDSLAQNRRHRQRFCGEFEANSTAFLRAPFRGPVAPVSGSISLWAGP